jgi:hypothetical protein
MDEMPWYDSISEDEVRRMFAQRGVKTLYRKLLGRNNNSKNQIYLAKDLAELASIPIGPVTQTAGKSAKVKAGGAIFHAPIRWSWLVPGSRSEAPEAQLIFYPQYPEVRLSGLLRGAKLPPSDLLSPTKRGLEPGRLLLFGPAVDDHVVGMILSSASPAAMSLSRFGDTDGILQTIPVDKTISTDSRSRLLNELARIHRLGSLPASELPKDLQMRPCSGPRCVGHTLEAHLGIPMNGTPEPDFGDWEVKAHAVTSFTRPAVGRVTLFTPEPDGGAYAEFGADWFVRRFGVKSVDRDRYDFTGVHTTTGGLHPKTGFQLAVLGYDLATGTIAVDGMVALLDINGSVASSWSFAKLLEHWQRKHAFAAYVASTSNKAKPRPSFSYGNLAHLASGTRFELFIKALIGGQVVYDPGIKSELRTGGTWQVKARSQFRINFRDLGLLYDDFQEVDVLAH